MRAEQKKQIGARLREKRELAGYTREQLGELCGLSPRFLANVELGDSTFSLETLMRVCFAAAATSCCSAAGQSPGTTCAPASAAWTPRTGARWKKHCRAFSRRWPGRERESSSLFAAQHP